jgi:hypothetical protein
MFRLGSVPRGRLGRFQVKLACINSFLIEREMILQILISWIKIEKGLRKQGNQVMNMLSLLDFPPLIKSWNFWRQFPPTSQIALVIGFRPHLAISLKNTPILDNKDRSKNGSV